MKRIELVLIVIMLVSETAVIAKVLIENYI